MRCIKLGSIMKGDSDAFICRHNASLINIEMCLKVPPEVFYPRPKVDSAILRFTKKDSPVIRDDQFVKFNKIVKAAFSKRRKMLRNSLAGFDIPKEIKSEIDFTRRPETLTIQEFAKLLT